MLIRGLIGLLLFQLLGTGLSSLWLPEIPGPIIGMLLLLGYLSLFERFAEDIRQASGTLLNYLPLLLVPPAVGIMVHVDSIAADFWAIAVALVGSLLVGIPLTGWLMQMLIHRQQRREDEP